MDAIEKYAGKNVTNKRVIDTFAPRLVGARIGSENYTRIMDEEREKMKLGEKNARLIDTIVDKLLHDEDDDFGARGFFGEIFEKIKSKIPYKPKSKDSYNNALTDGKGDEK
jgi:hypothetical protein